MAEEQVVVDREEAPPEVVVDVEPDEKAAKPLLSDEEVEKLAEAPAEDEVQRYAKDAQRRIRSMHTATQEWRKRVIRANNDLANATNLAQQLYNENQQLRQNNTRSEMALVEQAIQRADAMLQQARVNLRSARAAGDIDAETKAQEEIARYVSEGDRLRLLKPSAPSDGDRPPAAGATIAAAPAPQPRPVSEATRAWVDRNQWFNDPNEKEMRDFAMGIHHQLSLRGVTETSDPQAYFGAIDRQLRRAFPERFKEKDSGKEGAEPARSAGRPVAVVGGTRAAAVNGSNGSNGGNGKPRHVTLSESQLRVANGLGLTPEQYAMQLVKEGKT